MRDNLLNDFEESKEKDRVTNSLFDPVVNIRDLVLLVCCSWKVWAMSWPAKEISHPLLIRTSMSRKLGSTGHSKMDIRATTICKKDRLWPCGVLEGPSTSHDSFRWLRVKCPL